MPIEMGAAGRPPAPPHTASANTASTDSSTMTSFRGKSTFLPPKHRNASLETFFRLVENDISRVFNKKREYKVHDNLTNEQRMALKELNSDPTVIIKSADKGGAVVVMSSEDYDAEIRRQLGNATFYERLRSNPTDKYKKEIQTVLTSLLDSGEITKNEYDFMKVDHPVTPVIYILPKIHKNLEKPPGRPIIAGIGSLTEKISTFIDFFLKPHVVTLPSFIKDSMDLIKLLKDIHLPANIMLATFDVESLYTNIPHDGGISAIEFFLSAYHETRTPSVECIKRLTEIVLTRNFFMFKNDFFLQIKGTAMGSTMAPNYANLFVGHFEHNVVLNQAVNPFFHNILFYRRFIDDILVLWKGTETQLSEFQDFLNEKNDNLKFSGVFDKEKISFLDIMISIDGNRLKTDLYKKPTDRNTILHGKSYHPTSLKKNLPISQFNRIRRICSSDQDYAQQCTAMSERFREREYSEEWINSAADRFHTTDQEQCLNRKRHTETDNRLPCITQYSPLSRDFEAIVKRHWPILSSDPNLRDASFRQPPRFVYKRSPNIRNLVVKADRPPDHAPKRFPPVPDGNYRCGQCAQCNFTRKCNSFNHPHTGKSFKIKGVITCNTKNVIYMIKCPCGLAYIGKTTRCLKTRIAEHRSNIRLRDEKNPVAVHFNMAKHNLAALQYIGIEHVAIPRRGGDVDNLLLRREAFYIYTLNTMSPKGMNMYFDLKPFL